MAHGWVHPYRFVSLFTSVRLLWVFSITVLLKIITVGIKWDAFVWLVDKAISRPVGQTKFSAWADRIWVTKGPLTTTPQWQQCITCDGLLIKCFILLSTVRTEWFNITRNWRDWPEDKPLYSKLSKPFSLSVITIYPHCISFQKSNSD